MAAHQFPHYATPFVGRLTELAEISDRLNDRNCRLLTLVGPGGIGKTRLAIEAAMHNIAHFADGIYFVPFQPLDSTKFMVPAIAIAVGFQFYPGADPKQQLLDHIRDKALLLLVDNLEQLIEGADLFSEMLKVSPNLRILATSRERLNLAEEWIFEVRELHYPASESEADIESFDAVQLFLQHVRRMQTNFALTSLQKTAVIRICQLVGGMPLGIELAAASVRALSLEELAREIEHSLDILETPTRNIEPRHRNMRVALHPMWNGLSSKQQAVFRKLSVFRGGFTREAARYVAEASLQIMQVLVDRSLVWMDGDGRYDLHELLRQYAGEHLNEMAGELKAVHDQHGRYYMQWLAEKEKPLEGRAQKEALAEIQREIDNIRAAWNWAVESGDAVEIAKGCHALWFFYDTRSWYREGEQAFRAAAEALGLNDAHQAKTIALGKVLSAYGGFCFSLNMGQDARQYLEQSLSILRPYEAHAEIGFALLRLSEVGMFLEDNPLVAQTYLRESLALFQSVGSQWGTAYSLRWLGFTAVYLEAYEEAQQFAQNSLDIYEETGDPLGKALALNVATFSALALGEYEAAQQMCQEILVLAFDIGLRWSIPTALTMTGAALCGLGDYAQARLKLYEGLSDALEIQFMPSVLYALLEIAIYLIATEDKFKALAILAFMLKHPVPPIKGKRPVSRLVAKLQSELDAEDVANALEQGASLNLETVIQTGLDYTRPLPEAFSILNERERQILHLIAKGLSNREIATHLIFSVGTVKWYVHQIYDKLGVGSRTQAIDRARELNLLS